MLSIKLNQYQTYKYYKTLEIGQSIKAFDPTLLTRALYIHSNENVTILFNEFSSENSENVFYLYLIH